MFDDDTHLEAVDEMSLPELLVLVATEIDGEDMQDFSPVERARRERLFIECQRAARARLDAMQTCPYCGQHLDEDTGEHHA